MCVCVAELYASKTVDPDRGTTGRRALYGCLETAELSVDVARGPGRRGLRRVHGTKSCRYSIHDTVRGIVCVFTITCRTDYREPYPTV